MLSAESFVARTQRRGHRRAHAVMVIVVGLTAAASIALIAGSRRSSSVVERFFASAPRYDLQVAFTGVDVTPDQVRSIPGVRHAEISQYIALVGDARGHPQGINTVATDFSVRDPTLRVLKGRLPSSEYEVAVTETFVQQFGRSVGDPLPVRAFAPDQYDAVSQGVYEPHGPSYDMTIVGVVRPPSDIATDVVRTPRTTTPTGDNGMTVPVQFWIDHHAEFLNFGLGMVVSLDNGAAGVEQFVDRARALAGGENNVMFQPFTPSARPSAFQTPVDLETTALLAVGVGAAIATLAIATLLLRLQQRMFEQEQLACAAMGMSRGQFSAVACLRVLPAAVATSVLAAVGAIGLSARFPIGLGRQLELAPGVDVNHAVVWTGAAAVAIALVAIAALIARQRQAAVMNRHHGQHAASVHGAPLDVALGARLAMGSADGRRRVSSWAGLGASAVAIATVVAVGMWISGADHLYHDPGKRGWDWDVAVGNTNFKLAPGSAEDVEKSPFVADATAVTYGQVSIDGQSAEVLGYDPDGTAPPTVVSGRLPATAGEIALGAGLMRKLGVGVGDSVTFSTVGSEFAAEGSTPKDVELTVVGESVSPVFGESDIADVGVVTLDGIAAAGGDASPRIVLADVVGPNRSKSIDQLVASRSEEIHTDLIPARIVNMERVRTVPLVGLLLAAALGLVALTATIAASARSNRRTLAVLSALGLDSARRRRALGWQGAYLALLVSIIGIPLGLLAGAALWRKVTENLGVPGGSSFVPLTVPAVLVITALASITAALTTSRRNRKTNLAELLRSE